MIIFLFDMIIELYMMILNDIIWLSSMLWYYFVDMNIDMICYLACCCMYVSSWMLMILMNCWYFYWESYLI